MLVGSMQKYYIGNRQICQGEVLLETEWREVSGTKMTTAIDMVGTKLRSLSCFFTISFCRFLYPLVLIGT